VVCLASWSDLSVSSIRAARQERSLGRERAQSHLASGRLLVGRSTHRS
jgi:hypothetical protein